MSKEIALKISNVSKQYRLGVTGTGTLSDDLTRWWAKIRGKEDPFLKVGEVNDRSKEGGDYVWALKDINIEVRKGEILGIIGKNGAGKSTLLKLLSKITAPSTGSIKVNGRMASLLEVGTGFHPELTGEENVYLNGAILGMTKKEISSKMNEIVEFSGCAKYINTPVKRYSSGMRVRLGFAVAAFLDPDILVVDEVLAVGDAEFQKKAIGKMQNISSDGKRTVLFVSHNMSSIRNLCERVIVLNNGKVVFNGDSDEAISYYLKMNSSSSMLSIEKMFNSKAPIHFSNFNFIDSKGNENSYEYSDNVIIEVEVTKIDKIPYTYLGTIIEDPKGNLISFFGNDDFEVSELHLLENGKYTYRLTIPKKLLLPETYKLTITLRSSECNSPFHKLERAFEFTIIDTITKRGRENAFRKLTIVAPESKWEKIERN